jgi:hypothetical protein
MFAAAESFTTTKSVWAPAEFAFAKFVLTMFKSFPMATTPIYAPVIGARVPVWISVSIAVRISVRPIIRIVIGVRIDIRAGVNRAAEIYAKSSSGMRRTWA